MNMKYKKILKEIMTLTTAEYMCNSIKLNIYKIDEIFNTKNLKIEFRNSDTDELIHKMYIYVSKKNNQ